MSSIRIRGVRFTVYSRDHFPAHVHGMFGDAAVIVDILNGDAVALSERDDAISPANAKRNDVRKILTVAADAGPQLKELWEKVHGKL